MPLLQSEDWDVLAQAYIALVLQYGQCRVKHESVVKAWEEGRASLPPSWTGGR